MDFAATIRQLIQHALGMWRFRWQALAVAWLAAIAGWFYVIKLPNEYESFARVYVDTETTLKPLLSGLAVQVDTMSQVNLMTRALTSRPELEAVANETGIIGPQMDAGQVETALSDMSQALTIDQIGRQSIFEIRYRDINARMAHRVVETILNNFVSKSLRGDRSDTEQAQRFLEDQLAVYEQRLTEAEKRLADFKKENVGLMPGQGGGYYARLQEAQSEVSRVERLIRVAEERRRVLAAQLSGESGVIGSDVAKLDSPVDKTIATMEAELSGLLLRYTDKHPDVVRMRETLNDLYALRERERQALAGQNPMDPATAASNPVYQQLRVALSDTEVELAGLRSDLDEKRGQVAYLRSMVDTIPEVEARLNRLNRDYDVVKAQYEQLLGRLESAKLGEEVQEDSEQATFDVIEPPLVPLLAIGPNRKAMSLAVLVAALGLGGGLAFLLNQSRQTFFSTTELAEFTSLPVYGSIKLSVSALRHSIAPRALFAFFTLSLFGMYAAIILWGPTLAERIGPAMAS